MPVVAQLAPGKVVALWGSAVIRGADGKMHALKVGDAVHKGDVILTTQDGIVQIESQDATAVAKTPAPAATDDLDRVISGLNEGDARSVPAAGLNGGGGGSLEEGLRVGRIAEPLTAGGLIGTTTEAPIQRLPEAGSTVAPEKLAPPETTPETPPPLSAGSSAISASEEGAPKNLGLPAPTGTAPGATVTVTQVPAIGEIHKADGTLVSAGSTLAPADLPGLVYVPPADYNGTAPVGSFGYTVVSGGQTASGSTSVALTAVNDAPVATPDTGTGAEDGTLPIHLHGTDVDGTIVGVTVTSIPPGSTLLRADGVTPVLPGETLAPADAATLLFKPAADFNGSAGIVFTVTDNGGLTSAPATISLVVTPVNDAPVASADTASTAINTPIASIAVLANDRDVDGDTLSVTAATLANPALGTVSINPDGTLAFNPAANISGPVVINYTVSDPSGATSSAQLTVNVGANTPPAGADASLTLAEDSPRSFGAADFGFSDADAGQALANVRIDSLPAAGALTLNGAAVVAGQVIAASDLSHLSFAPAANANGNAYASFTFSVQDSAGAFDPSPNTITLNVTPVADPAVIGGQASGATVEDNQLTATGTLTIVDPDAGEAAFVAQAGVAGAHGSFSIGADGAWTYTLNNADPAVQALGQGQTLPSETFTVRSVDGTTQVVTVSITGTNDAAVITAGAGSVTEDTQPTTGGTLAVSDADAGQATFVAQAATAGSYGSFTLGADGTWTYALNSALPAVQALGQGQTLTETFAVASADGTLSSVTVTINGSNDAAVIGGTAVGSVTEDGVLATGGTLTVSDVDGPATFVAQAATAGSYGSFTLGADGTWTYALNNALPAVQALGQGQTLTETFSVAAADGTTSNVVVTINGTDDAPVISTGTGSVIEDTQPSASGTLTASDVDNPALAFVPATVAGSFGSLTLAANGQWTYTLDPRADVLAKDQAANDVITVTLNDGSTTTVSIAITGTNDAAVITGTASGTVSEDGTLGATGTLTATDVDSPATFTAANAVGTYGNFAIAANGTWTYTLRNGDANVQALTSSQHPTETFSVTTADGTVQQITITVNGANETPTATVTPASGSEDTPVPITLAGSDVDGTIAGFTITALPTNGTLLFNGNPVAIGTVIPASAGSAALSFVPAANWNGSTTIGFTATDNEGAVSSPVSQSITVAAVNDAPVALDDAASTAINTPIASIPVLANDSDVDGDALSVTAATLANPALGTVSINPDGTLAFSPAANISGPVVINYTVSDPSGATSTAQLTVNVGNNTPPAGTDKVVGLDEDTSRSFSGADFGFSDADAGQVLANVRIDTLPGAGTLSFNGTPVVVGQVIAAASLAQLVFTPAANANGNAYASFTFSVQDSAGAFDPSPNTITLNVTPVADPAVIGGQASGTTIEDTKLTATGTLTIVDPDAGEAVFVAQTGAAGAHGSFSIGTDGVWTYTLNNADPAVQALGQGQTLTETFQVRSADGTTSSVVVTINGTNDAAVISAGTGSVTEDVGVVGGNIATSGTLTVTDVDAGQASFQAQPSTAGAYGTFTLGANGAWTYTAANGNAAIQALGAGQTLTETFTVRSADGTTSSVVVTINGTNDAAVISAGTGSVTEDVGVVGGNIATSGTLTVTDVDAGQASFQAQASTAGAYGTFTLGANGAWTYTAANSNPTIQALGAGQTLTETFAVRSADGTASSVVVTINGTNDAAVISAGTGSITEDVGVVGGNIATSGTLTVTDVDAGQATFQAQPSTAGTYGTFTLGANGAWTYTAANGNPTIQALGAGQTLTETFTVRSADGTASSVVVTINGTNDAAVISAGTGSVTEDTAVNGAGNITTGGTLTVSDVDAGQASFQAQASTAGAYGTFTLGANGAWTYTAANSNPTIQALGAGQTLTETFTVRSADGTASSVVVTIDGTNDAAVISTGTGSVTEDLGVVGGNIATSGTLTVSDVDAGQASFQAQASTAGAYGNFTLGANGAWTYTAANSNPTIQALGAGQTLTETFTVRSADGTASSVVVTINGTNDAAVISAGTGSVTEDVGVVGGNIATSGTLTLTDVDAGQSSFQAQASTAGAYGTFTLGANGAWTYTAANSNPTIQALGAGQTLTETFTVRSADGTASSVVVTINGTNDAAVISSGTGSVTEDVGVVGGNIASSGTLTVTDVDAGQATFQAQPSTAGAYGTFTLGANGAWTYTAANSNPTIQALGAGQTLTETFTVRSADGTASSVVVTINGTNDAAVISAGTGSVTEDVGVVGGNIATSGTLTVTDVDAGQATFQAQPSTAGAYGTFTLGANGAWTYTAANSNPTIQALGAGQTLTETFTVRSADGTASSVVVTINGTNDAAVISAGTGSVTEDVGVVGGNIATSGTLTVTDVDAGQATFQAQPSTAGTYGTFTLGANGAWTYTASNSNPTIQALGAGQTLTETFTVRSADGTTSSVVVTINGTNDAAVISSGTGSVTEDTAVNGAGNITTGGTLTVSDVDAGQSSFQAQASTAGAYGTFTLGANGAWTYTAANSNPTIQALGAGQTLTETFTVRSADGTASSVVVTINGTNDAAVISSGTGSVTEDTAVNGAGNITTGGTLTVSDVDAGQASFQAQASTAGTYGTFTLGANGAWTYTAANSNPTIQALGAGQTLTETFTVRSADGTASSVVVTINGTNDTAVISGNSSGAVTEAGGVNNGNAGSPSVSGTLTVADVDAGQATFQAPAPASLNGTYGTFTFNPGTGAWTYALDNTRTATQGLNAGQSAHDTLTVASADGSATRIIDVTVNGSNDNASITGTATGSVTEAGGVNNGSAGTPTATGTLAVADVDAGQATFQTPAPASLNGTYGSFTFNAGTGAWTYTLDNSRTATQALVAGQVVHDALTVTSTDGTATQIIDVTVNGANDTAAVGGTATGSVTEAGGANNGTAGTPSASGTLTVTDVDAGQAGFQTPAAGSLAGTYGTFTFNAGTGAWTYTLDNTRTATQALVAGQIAHDTLTITSTDGSASRIIDVTVNGSNDNAAISGTTTGAVTEAGGVNNGSAGTPNASGTLTVADVDAGQATFQAPAAASLNGTFGTFTFNAGTGAWTYALDNTRTATQALVAGQIAHDTLTVTSSDGSASQIIDVSVNGSNDTAAIAGTATGSVTEAGGVNNGSAGTPVASGTLTVTDVDSGQAVFQAPAAASLNGTYGSFTFNAGTGDWTYTLDNTRTATQALAAGQVVHDTLSVTSSDGTATRTVDVTVNGSNDAPVAGNDTGSVTASATLTVTTANGVILSGGNAAGRDTDVDSGDTLTVARGIAGSGTPTTAVTAAGTTFTGTYGDLLLKSDGSYTYVANKADAVATGATVNDVFTYQVADANGGTANATLTVQVAGQADTLTAGTPTTTALANPLGLNGEFYGYNDFNPSGSNANRRHGDDGTVGNLDHVSDFNTIVNSRNAAVGGSNAILGTNIAASTNAVDARFVVKTLDYGTSPTVTSSLGTNVNVAAGGSTSGLTNSNSQLFRFLNRDAGSDAGSITIEKGTADNDTGGTGPTSGLGSTSDAALRLTGVADLAAGLYDIRVYADDGFRLNLDGHTVAVYDDIQSPTTRVYTGVAVDGGLTPLELIYWEQGGNANLRVEFKVSGAADSTYKILGSDNMPIFSQSNAPTLSETQDIVAGSTTGTYNIRTGSTLDGGVGNDTITGSAARDKLIGGLGNDILSGGAGNDILIGGKGNDTLTGGAGHDVFRWSLGDGGTAGAPARDVISDFDNASYSGDVLDLRDLLVGESHAANVSTLPSAIGTSNALTITAANGNLGNYLHFSVSGSDTVVEVSTTGGFSGGYSSAAVDQVITIQGVNLMSGMSTDAQVINDLLKRGKLLADTP